MFAQLASRLVALFGNISGSISRNLSGPTSGHSSGNSKWQRLGVERLII